MALNTVTSHIKHLTHNQLLQHASKVYGRNESSHHEMLVVLVDDGGGGAPRANENNPPNIRGQLDGPLGRDGIRGIEDGGIRQRPKQGEVFQRHLRRAVLADRDADVRADAFDVREGDRRHAQLVRRAREERRECAAGGKSRSQRYKVTGRRGERGARKNPVGTMQWQLA